jgi:hypothetical protein
MASGVDISFLWIVLRLEFTLRKRGGLQILCCQGFEVKSYDVTSDAVTLKPSDVCSVEVYPESTVNENTRIKSRH